MPRRNVPSRAGGSYVTRALSPQQPWPRHPGAACVPAARGATAGRVVVVGAGLAGLTCAYRLKQAGIERHVLRGVRPAWAGAAGRGRGDFASGQIAEHGGELIDQSHTAHPPARAGARASTLDNLLAAEVNGTEPLYHFDGDAVHLRGGDRRPEGDLAEAPPGRLRGQLPDAVRLLHPARSRARSACRSSSGSSETSPRRTQRRSSASCSSVAYNIEYGGGAERAELRSTCSTCSRYIGPGPVPDLRAVEREVPRARRQRPDSDQAGRAALRPDHARLASSWPSSATPAGGYSLDIRDRPRGTKTCRRGPASCWRFRSRSFARSVNLLEGRFLGDARCRRSSSSASGTNSKLHLQFTRPASGTSSSATARRSPTRGYQNTWEVTRAQPGRAGILVDYTGGDVGDSFGSGTPTSRAQQFFEQIDPVIPGLATESGTAAARSTTGRVRRPLSRTRSYSFWKVGQYTSFAGIEGRPEGGAATSPASTPRSTSRATSTAPSRRASAPRRRCLTT